MLRTAGWQAVLRGLVLLGLGTAGMIRQMFFVGEPSAMWVGISLAMIMGEGAVSAWWLAGRSSGTAPQSGPLGAYPREESHGSPNGP